MNCSPSRGQRKNIKFSRPAAKCCWPLFMQQGTTCVFLSASVRPSYAGLFWCCNNGCSTQSFANLHQVDLLSPSENKIKNQEYYASRYGQEKLDKLNEQILADGLTPRKTTFQTQKQYLRDAITEISHTAKDVEDFKKREYETFSVK